MRKGPTTFKEYRSWSPLAQFWFFHDGPDQMRYYRELLEKTPGRHPKLIYQGRAIMGLVRERSERKETDYGCR